MTEWPPQLADLKEDAQIPGTGEDDLLQRHVNAAVAFVQGQRSDLDFGPHPLGTPPSDDVWLGTIRLAARWFARRRSPDALIDMAELGQARIPSFDPDIERLLGIGRFRGPVFA